MVRDPLAGVLAPLKKTTQLLEALPQLQRLAEIDIAMVSNIDSSDLQPEPRPRFLSLWMLRNPWYVPIHSGLWLVN